MRIVFAGTPAFAVPCLRAAHAHHEVVAVYTQPDRPCGRGKKCQPGAVKTLALSTGLPIHQPPSQSPIRMGHPFRHRQKAE